MNSNPIEDQVREDHFVHGILLGDLIQKYGVDCVVKALGVMTISHILGLDEPVPSPEDDESYERA